MITFLNALVVVTLVEAFKYVTVDAFLLSIEGPAACNDFISGGARAMRRTNSIGFVSLSPINGNHNKKLVKLYGFRTDPKASAKETSASTQKSPRRNRGQKQGITSKVKDNDNAHEEPYAVLDSMEPLDSSLKLPIGPKTNEKATRVKNASPVYIEPLHWVVPSDDILFQEMFYETEHAASVQVPSLLRFTVRGNPLPLRRHRTSRGFVYNPSAASQKSFRTIVEQIIAAHVIFRNSTSDVHHAMPLSNGTDNHTSSLYCELVSLNQRPLWDALQPIAVSIVFRMKRPKSHFIANRPGVNRLRKLAPRHMCATSMRTDVDNLAKFVLDSLNGLVYADDRQIVSLHVTKLYDNDDTGRMYQGSTCVCIRLLQDDNIPKLLLTSMNMF